MSKEKSGALYDMGERLYNGILKENPTFVLTLGMCPTLAVTTSAINGLGMGLTTMVVLALSNLIISSLRKFIPNKIRIPAFIVIIASFVTVVELLLRAFIPTLYDALGLYIPLIVVNCIILGRAEAYAYSHKPLPSLFDGIGMGLGFSLALTIIGAFRELLGSGKVFGYMVMPEGFVPVSIFIMAPGAFFVLAMLTAIQNKVKEVGTKQGKDMSMIQSGCGGNCLECSKECKVETVIDPTVAPIVSNEIPSEEIKLEEMNDVTEEKNAETKEASIDEKALAKQQKKESKAKAKEEKKAKALEEKNAKAEAKAKAQAEKSKETEATKPVKEETEPTLEPAPDTTEEPKKEVESDVDKKTEKTPEKETKKEPKQKGLKKKEDKITSKEEEDDDFELLNLEDFVNGSKNAKGSNNKTHKKAGVDKAKLLLSNAEESMKEEQNND